MIAKRVFKTILTPPLLLLVVPVVLYFDVLHPPIKALFAQLTRLRLVARAEAWAASLPPCGVLALFLLPMVALAPLNILGGYLISAGHPVAGAALLVLLKVASTGYCGRLMVVGKDKLMTYRLFVFGHTLYGRVHDGLLWMFRAIPGLAALRAACRQALGVVRDGLLALRACLPRRGLLALRWAALMRRARRA